MSLRVWLPLNGSLKNQGLTDITITNNNATINNNGKIGQCYAFNGSNNYIRINYNFYNIQYSVSAWVYSTSASAIQTVCCNRTATGSGFSIFLIGGKLRIDPGGNNTQWTTNYTYPINTWFHLCVTYDGTKVSYYINGEFKESSNRTINSSYWGNVTSIGASQVNNSSYSNYLNGRLNDVRIYDHCLSQKEIEEIAKGLVLHYKLDTVEQDYATNLVTSLTSGGQTIVDGNKIITSGTNADTYFTINLSESIVNGTSYIISCDAIVPEGTCWTFPLGKQANTVLSFQIYNGHNIFPFTANDIEWGTNRIFMDDGGSPNSARSTGVQTELFNFCVTKVGFIQDTSGYNNNGTIVGNIELDTNTIKYSHSIKKINGQYIRVDKRPVECMPKDAITVNLWQYATTWSNPISCTEGGGWNFENTNSGIRFPVYISGVGYKVAQSSLMPASTLNAWHMLTGTMDANNVKIYYDGEEVGTVATGSTNGIGYANNYIFIGGEASGNSISPASSSYVGNISDVRIYATALTPNQIKELYHTSAAIDNNSNVYAREVIE